MRAAFPIACACVLVWTRALPARAEYRSLVAWPLSQRNMARLPERVRQNAAAVGEVTIFERGQPRRGGTAVLIHLQGSRGYVLTNHHVIEERFPDQSATVDFHREGSNGSKARPAWSHKLSPSTAVFTPVPRRRYGA